MSTPGGIVMCFSRLLCLILGLLLFNPVSYANKVERLSFSGGSPSMIWVYSDNGEKWTDVDESKPVSVSVNTDMECKYEGNVSGKNPYSGNLLVAGLNRTSGGEIYSDMTQVKGKYRYVGPIAQDPVKACNKELEKRVATLEGKTKYHFLSEGFIVDSPGALQAQLSLVCKATGLGFDDYKDVGGYLDVRVNCQASPKAAGKIPKPEVKVAKVKLGPLIKTVSFNANPANQTGKCPAGVKFTGKVTTTRAGEVKYRYKGSGNNESPVYTLKFSAAGTKNTANWNRTINPGAGGKDQIQAAGSGDPVYNGWQRIEVMSPEQGSKQVNFKITCKDDAPGTMTIQKATPSRAQK